MVSAHSPEHSTTTAKIVVAGGFGAGKTTLVSAISEIPPINTEAWMTTAGTRDDPLEADSDKSTTTVAMDFGRRTLADDLVLYLFGTPGQQRFWPMWDDLCRGASGALVLVDTRHLDRSFAAVNYFENDSTVPFVVGVNMFHGEQTHGLDVVRQALSLPESVPLCAFDARDRAQVAGALVGVVEHSMARTARSAPTRPMTPAGR